MKRITIKDNLEFLKQVSTDIDFTKDDYLGYIKELKKFCRNNKVYALAPVQIGITKRIIYLRNTTEDMNKNTNSNYDEEIVLINPTIISSKGNTRFLERCASCLDYVGVVNRPYMVEVEYFDINGVKHREIFEGFKATVFSHEYDHLDGILHIDIADNLMKMSLEETKKYRLEHPYEVMSKDNEFKRKVKTI